MVLSLELNILFIMSNNANMDAPKSNINVPDSGKFDASGLITMPTPMKPHNVANHRARPMFSCNIIAAKSSVNIGMVKVMREATLRGTDFNPEHHNVMPENNIRPRTIWASGLVVFSDFNWFFNTNGNNVITPKKNRMNTICNG